MDERPGGDWPWRELVSFAKDAQSFLAEVGVDARRKMQRNKRGVVVVEIMGY